MAATTDTRTGQRAAARRPPLDALAAGAVEFLWPMSVAVVGTLVAWVLVPTLALGWQPVTIISGSMAPAIPAGRVVLVEPYRGQPIDDGAVVTYRDRTERLVTHRVAEVHPDDTFTTRGDANPIADPEPLTADRIVGVGRIAVPAAGLPGLWAHEGRHELLAGAVVAPALLAVGATRGVRPRRRYRPKHLRRRPRTVPARTVAVAAVVAVATAGMASLATFAAAHTNAGNAFEARTMTAPATLSASWRCTLLGLVQTPKVRLAWTASPDASDGYQIWRSTSPDTGFALRGTTAALSFDDEPVSYATTYHYRVVAVDGSWTSVAAASAFTTPLVCLV